MFWLRPEKIYVSMVVYKRLSAFLTIDHLPRVSHQSLNDKDDSEVKPGAVHRSPGIYLAAEEKLR